MSDSAFGVLGGMALAEMESNGRRSAAHEREVAGIMEYQGNVAEATLDVARKTLGWASQTHKLAEYGYQQGKNNLQAIDRNVVEIRGVKAVADATKAVVDDTREGLRINLDVTKEARNNTRNLLDLVTDMHQSQTMMIDVLERVIKRDEALEKEVHELRDQLNNRSTPSMD